ncbi:MAG: insulinase family protein [Candidatus Eremiobacteraeota bacterium]|nr:insulinase family protein [Candidatus Eremiobacteraeota bacterium]
MSRFCIVLVFILALTLPTNAIELDKEKNTGITTLALPGSEVVYVVLSFRTGAVNDPEGKEGLNYVTTRLIEEQIDRAINEKAPASGASFSAQADKEITTFFFKAHREKFNEVYPVFIAGITSPRINADSLQRALAQAANHRDHISRHGESLAQAALERFIYRGHPYGTPDSGTEKSLAALTVREVTSFFASRYTKENYELGVAGRECGMIKKQVMSDLDALPPGKPEMKAIGTPEPIERNRVLIIRKDGDACDVALGFPVDFTRADDDFYPLMITNAHFGQHRYLNCLLSRELRKVRGFNYGDYSYLEKFREGGQDKMPGVRIPRLRQYFSIWLRSLSNENACFAARYALYQFNQMAEKGLSEKDFRIMRDFVTYNSKLWDYDPFQKLGFSMDSDFYHIPYFIASIGERMKKITAGEVSSALGRRLADRKVKMVFVTDDPETLKGRLLGKIDARPVYKSALPEDERKVDEQVLKYDPGLTTGDIEIVEAKDLF